MKKKDLNTFIQDKLEQENGIPFKDDYWLQMNELLDANLPVSKVTTAAKGISNNLKFIYFTAASILLIIVSFLMFQYVNSTSNSTNATQNKNLDSLDINAKTFNEANPNWVQKPKMFVQKQKPQTQKSIIIRSEPNMIEKSNLLNQSTPKIETNSLKNKIDFASKTSYKIHQNSFEPSAIESQLTKTGFTNSNATFLKNPSSPVNEIKEITNSKKAFNFLFPHLTYFNLKTPYLTLNQMSSTNHVYKNSQFKHLNISAFVGVIHPSDAKSNQTYTLPNQTNLTYGFNVEGTINRLSFRTGMAITYVSVHQNTQYVSHEYTVDTAYKIINPNYGTTLSGKPVALVQKQLDTIAVATQTYSKESTYRYQMLSIPTMIQFKLPYNRFMFILEGGGLHHIMVSQQSSSPIQFTSNENHHALPAYSMQISTGAGLHYAFNYNWALGINYLYGFNPKQSNVSIMNHTHQGYISITRYLW